MLFVSTLFSGLASRLLPLLRQFALPALLIGVAAFYWWWSQRRIDALTREVTEVARQAKDLEAANEAIRADVVLVKRAADAANAALVDARTRAQQAARAIRSQTLSTDATARPRETEDQLNRATADAFRQLEELSRHAP